MRNKRMILPALALCALLLAGCSLALPAEEAGEARLAGALVRVQPGGFDPNDEFIPYDQEAVERYLADHPSLLNGGEIELPEGMPAGVHIVTDEDLDACLLWTEEETETGERSVGVECGGMFQLVRQHITDTDEGRDVEVGAAVYLDPEAARGDEALVTVYPVYRRPDGLLYAEDNGGMMGIIDGFAQSFRESFVRTDSQGGKTTSSFSVEVSFSAQPRAESAVLVEMSADDRPISRRELELSPGEQTVRLSPEAAWALIEAQAVGKAPGEPARRLLLRLLLNPDGEDSVVTLYVPGEDGILLPCAVRAEK